MMTKDEFDQLVDLVVTTGVKPPRVLFTHGVGDWYTRASLAKFLYHPAYNQIDAAIKLFESVTNVQVTAPEDIEHKAWALKHLSSALRNKKAPESALQYINESIKLAESIDHTYHTILRGDLWAERWIILNALNQTTLAVDEANQTIMKFASKFVKNNSYVYNAYRFKAQVAAAKGEIGEALSLMKKALSFIKLSDQDKQNLAISFSARHQNIALILRNIDLATPEKIEWIV